MHVSRPPEGYSSRYKAFTWILACRMTIIRMELVMLVRTAETRIRMGCKTT